MQMHVAVRSAKNQKFKGQDYLDAWRWLWGTVTTPWPRCDGLVICEIHFRCSKANYFSCFTLTFTFIEHFKV